MQLTNETVRQRLERDLQGMADGLGEELLVDGTLYRQHLDGKVDYHSLCGPLTVGRYTCREVGLRNGPTVVPLELAAGIVARISRSRRRRAEHPPIGKRERSPIK